MHKGSESEYDTSQVLVNVQAKFCETHQVQQFGTDLELQNFERSALQAK